MITVLKPIVHQTVAIVIAIHAWGIVLSHCWPPRPSATSVWLIRPWFWKSHHQITAAAVTDSVYGAKNTIRKKLRPRNRLLRRTARKTAKTTSGGTLTIMNVTVARIERQKLAAWMVAGSTSRV